MSDEPTFLGETITQRPRGPLGHVGEHAGCGKDAGWGFARPKRPSHWFCYEHRAEGETYL